jgi:alkylation response protein AidB-like acyl-CoA dehydrogenase
LDFRLTPDHEDLRLAARDLAQGEFAPVAEAWDRDAELLPGASRRRLGELGYLGMTLPESYGGWQAPLFDALLILEEFGKACLAPAFAIFEAAVGGVRVIELLGTDEQRRRWLPAVAAGEATMAVAISEPDAGSAATDMRTRARMDGDEIVLNGTKRWCSGAGHSELYLVYCRLSDEPGAKGIGAVVVEHDAPGLEFGPRQIHLGFRSVAHADVFLDDCRVPGSCLLGGKEKLDERLARAREGTRSRGQAAMQTFEASRPTVGAQAIGIARAAYEYALDYAINRVQFGKPIVEN